MPVAVRWFVLSTEPLTTYDLDEIGHTSFRADRPLQVAAELVDAVEQGWLADQADTGYALILAAEIMERAGDLPAAEALAERAVAAYQAHRDPGYGYPRAFRAGLLMQLGREDEAMAELTALRPLLSQDADAVSYISETLEECGHAEIAEQWLTAALAPALRRREALESQRATPAYEQAAMLAFSLIQNRHRVRRDLDLPHDAQDDLADQLAEAVEQALGDDELELKGVAVLFWPQPEFDRLLQRWPVLADVYGRTWDEHRAILQRTLMQLAESGHTRLAVLPGAAEELARYASRNGEEPTEPQVRRDYAEYLGDQAAQLIWPPGRNQSCWCDSGLKYKKCCLPRTRD